MEGRLNYAPFMIEGQGFAAMDGYTPDGGQVFSFNEAISFLVNCDTQEEIDYYWEKLSAVPEAEQCGWLKDKFGISWQINPSVMRQMMTDGSKEKLARVTNAFLKMKKFDINELKKAYDG
jgi:predicted 3-demethylubiquinone-9 3-methyltransferase (glyoxalase superfamily)